MKYNYFYIIHVMFLIKSIQSKTIVVQINYKIALETETGIMIK